MWVALGPNEHYRDNSTIQTAIHQNGDTTHELLQNCMQLAMNFHATRHELPDFAMNFQESQEKSENANTVRTDSFQHECMVQETASRNTRRSSFEWCVCQPTAPAQLLRKPTCCTLRTYMKLLERGRTAHHHNSKDAAFDSDGPESCQSNV